MCGSAARYSALGIGTIPLAPRSGERAATKRPGEQGAVRNLPVSVSGRVPFECGAGAARHLLRKALRHARISARGLSRAQPSRLASHRAAPTDFLLSLLWRATREARLALTAS